MKMNRVLFGITAICITVTLSGQEKDTIFWKHQERFGLNFNQASFSNSWKGGGNNSVSFGSLFLGNLEYKKAKLGWDNEIDLQYGILKNQNQDARKSDDRIYIDSKLGYSLSGDWNAFTSLNFQTQFDKGYEYGVDENGAESKALISGFMAPAFITSAWGAEYKPVDHFNLRFSPLSPRITILSDTTIHRHVPGNYGVEIGETVRYEWLAFKLAASYEKELYKDILFKARYEFFANYQEFQPGKFDHRLDLALNARVFKAINFSLMSTLLYDFDQGDEMQASFSSGIGLLFILGNLPEE